MRRAVHAEWTKLRTAPSTAWLAFAAVAATVAVGAAATASIDVSQCPTPTECFEDTTKMSLTGVWLGQVAVVVLAVLAFTNEHGTRMIQTTFAANPRRVQVLASKLAVVTGVTFGTATIGVLGALWLSREILPGNGFTPANGYPPLSLADEPTFRAAVGTVLYLGLIAVLSVGVGAMVRDTAGAVTAILALLYAFPMLASFVTDPVWQLRLQRFSPMTAGLAVQATRGLDAIPIGPWAGLGVLAAYAGTALILGATLVRLRDA